jgi:hypothetical protein
MAKQDMTAFIDHDEELIFIHTPKTGGTSITECLVGLDNTNAAMKVFGIKVKNVDYIDGAHITTTDIRKKIGDERYESYYSFAIMREPYDWLISLFEHNCRQYSNFEIFIDTFFSINQNLQSHWFTTNKTVDVDFLGNFSQLNKEIEKILEQLKNPPKNKLRHINTRKENHIKNHYENDRIIEKATKLLKTDLSLYRNRFGPKEN